MSMGRGGMFGDPRSQVEKDMEARMFGLLSPDTQQAGDQYAAMDGLLAPERPQGFWQGGGKFGVKDGLAGLLAAAGDALMAQAGMGGGAVQGLAGGRMSAMDDLKKQAAQEQKMRELIAIGQANGLSEAQVRMQHAGLEGPEQPKQHELQQLAALADDPTQPQSVRDAARVRLAGEPFISTTLPNGQFFMGRPSQIGGMGGGGSQDIGETLPPGWKIDGGGTGSGAGRFPVR